MPVDHDSFDNSEDEEEEQEEGDAFAADAPNSSSGHEAGKEERSAAGLGAAGQVCADMLLGSTRSCSPTRGARWRI